MKSLINNPVKVFATGFIVLVLLSVPLFYIRIICEASLLTGMPVDVRKVVISPSDLDVSSRTSSFLWDFRLFSSENPGRAPLERLFLLLRHKLYVF
jgi:hypothetical protein